MSTERQLQAIASGKCRSTGPWSWAWPWRSGLRSVSSPGDTTGCRWCPKGHGYRRFVSDLSGYDPTEHDGSPETVVAAVMPWLATRTEERICQEPRQVLDALKMFQQSRHELRRTWLGREPWMDVIELAIRTGTSLGLIPPPSGG